MEFHVPDAGHAGFRHIHPRLADCLRGIPTYLGDLTTKAEQRFFPLPTRDSDADELRADWKAHVEPDLHSHFRSTRDIVTADLRGMTEDAGEFSLTIPDNHIDAWLNVLTQIRLALAEDFELDRAATPPDEEPDLTSEKGLAMLRSELFIFMQECLVRHVE